MSYKKKITKKVVYEIEATNESPISIKDFEDNIKKDVISGQFFIPGTSIAGALRSYYSKQNKAKCDKLFGGINTHMSLVTCYDAHIKLDDDNKYLKGVRPGLKIDSEYLVGAEGSKFDREFIESGTTFEFRFVTTSYSLTDEKLIEDFNGVIDAFLSGLILLGNNKTIGYGSFKTDNFKKMDYDFNNINDLFKYALDKKTKEKTVSINKIDSAKGKTIIELKGKTHTPFLIKSDEHSDIADSINMKDGKGEYIIPGSSIKGALRARCEKILKTFEEKINLESLELLFGSGKENNGGESRMSCVYCYDTKIEKANSKVYNSIKIDYFTGGVMDSALMNEEVIMGDVSIKVVVDSIESENQKAYIGLLILAMRDLGTGKLNLGSGFAKGRGYLKADSLRLNDDEKKIYIDFNNPKQEEVAKIDEYVKEVIS